MGKLNDSICRSAKAKEVRYRLADGHGLSLEVRPSAEKAWLLYYRPTGGKPSYKTLGRYPTMGLSAARDAAMALRVNVKAGHAKAGVEQQALTNSLLKEMLGNSSGGTLASVSGWIGKEVRTTGPVLFDGSPVTLDIEPAAEADAVSLVVLDAQGKEVSQTSIGTGSGEVDWQGRGDDGALLASGLYQFRVESSKGGTVLSTEDAAAYGMVTGAKLENGAAQLVLAGGATVAAEDVTGIRNAEG